MKLRWDVWLKGLAAAIVGGSANSFLTSLGITGAQIVGIKIDQLSPKQLGVATIIGGLVGAAFYFKQSPVPPEVPPEN